LGGYATAASPTEVMTLKDVGRWQARCCMRVQQGPVVA